MKAWLAQHAIKVAALLVLGLSAGVYFWPVDPEKAEYLAANACLKKIETEQVPCELLPCVSGFMSKYASSQRADLLRTRFMYDLSSSWCGARPKREVAEKPKPPAPPPESPKPAAPVETQQTPPPAPPAQIAEQPKPPPEPAQPAKPIGEAPTVAPADATASKPAAIGWLGVELADIDADRAERLGMARPRGVAVDWLPADSPALAAGVQPDDVILAIDGAPVNSSDKLTERVRAIAPHTTITLRVWRDGEETEIDAILAERSSQFDTGATVNTKELKLRSCPEFAKACPEIVRLYEGNHARFMGDAGNGWVKLSVKTDEGKWVTGYANRKYLQF